MLCAKFGWNWSIGYGGEDFGFLSIYFHSFVIISSWKRSWSFIWTNLISLHQRMLCTKFSGNWSRVLEEKKKMWKVYNNNDDDAEEQRTNCDQISSLESSAQVSYKLYINNNVVLRTRILHIYHIIWYLNILWSFYILSSHHIYSCIYTKIAYMWYIYRGVNFWKLLWGRSPA